MNRAPGRWTRWSLCAALAAAPALAGTSETAAAKERVVSVLEMSGGGHSKLTLHHVEGKRYLYAHRISDRSLTIIDVTNEANPRVVKTLTSESLASLVDVHILPGGELLLSRAENGKAQPDSSYSLALWNPVNNNDPNDIGVVTSHLVESGRGILYLSSDKGVTLIRLHASPEKLEEQRWASTLAP